MCKSCSFLHLVSGFTMKVSHLFGLINGSMDPRDNKKKQRLLNLLQGNRHAAEEEIHPFRRRRRSRFSPEMWRKFHQ